VIGVIGLIVIPPLLAVGLFVLFLPTFTHYGPTMLSTGAQVRIRPSSSEFAVATYTTRYQPRAFLMSGWKHHDWNISRVYVCDASSGAIREVFCDSRKRDHSTRLLGWTPDGAIVFQTDELTIADSKTLTYQAGTEKSPRRLKTPPAMASPDLNDARFAIEAFNNSGGGRRGIYRRNVGARLDAPFESTWTRLLEVDSMTAALHAVVAPVQLQ
jgi:hypothetical protein